VGGICRAAAGTSAPLHPFLPETGSASLIAGAEKGASGAGAGASGGEVRGSHLALARFWRCASVPRAFREGIEPSGAATAAALSKLRLEGKVAVVITGRNIGMARHIDLLGLT
jgi:hypothetical protein